jgi:hypothetical protein
MRLRYWKRASSPCTASRPPACPSSGNIPGLPGSVHLCGDKNFHKICSLFSIPYRPISPAAASQPVTLVVGRFMPRFHSSRLASFRIRVRSRTRVHSPARIGFVPSLWRISIGTRPSAFRCSPIGFGSRASREPAPTLGPRPQATESTCLTPELASFRQVSPAFRLGPFGQKP